MNRRDFISKSASIVFGGLLGLSGLSEAHAFARDRSRRSSPCFISLIIDDIGYSRAAAMRFFELGVPLTYSILPRLPYSHELAREIHLRGHETMLHQPMEPHDPSIDPGPGALYVGDGVDTIVGIMEENVYRVPFAVGANNHMGSKFTEHRRETQEALQILKQKGLFFIDSLTSTHSLAHEAATDLKITNACRNVFLDNHTDESYILAQLRKLVRHARVYGHAIGIGHPHPETARAIGCFVKGNMDPRVSMVYVSRLLQLRQSVFI